VNKYCEGKIKRTLKRELKEREIGIGEAFCRVIVAVYSGWNVVMVSFIGFFQGFYRWFPLLLKAIFMPLTEKCQFILQEKGVCGHSFLGLGVSYVSTVG